MWRESFIATSDSHPWLVAVGDEREHKSSLDHHADRRAIIGFAKSSPWKGRCAYNWSAEVTVYVDPERQGSGIGRALYTRLINILREQGYRTLLGGITQPNEASVRLHESLGFKRVALFRRVGYKFERWWDVGYWELELDLSDAGPAQIRSVVDVVSSHQSRPSQ